MVTALIATRCAAPLTGRPANTRSRSRGQHVIRAAEADRTRAQDTVLDLRKEEIDKAIERQLERSKLRTEGGGRPAADQRDVHILANETAQPPSEDGDGESDANGAQAPQLNILEPAQSTKEDAEASARVLAEVRERVPLMDAASEKAGLKRLLGTAGTLGLQQLDDSETASTEDSGPPPQEDSEPEVARGQWDPDRVYEDGSFLYTAETLSRDGSA